jgi:hypothetical protein
MKHYVGNILKDDLLNKRSMWKVDGQLNFLRINHKFWIYNHNFSESFLQDYGSTTRHFGITLKEICVAFLVVGGTTYSEYSDTIFLQISVVILRIIPTSDIFPSEWITFLERQITVSMQVTCSEDTWIESRGRLLPYQSMILCFTFKHRCFLPNICNSAICYRITLRLT